MAKHKPLVNQDTYQREFAPLLHAIAEKARTFNCSCLVAVEVDGTIHIGGNILGNSPKMQEAFALLFEDDELSSQGPMTRGGEAAESE